jgi:hypothetical protein
MNPLVPADLAAIVFVLMAILTTHALVWFLKRIGFQTIHVMYTWMWLPIIIVTFHLLPFKSSFEFRGEFGYWLTSTRDTLRNVDLFWPLFILISALIIWLWLRPSDSSNEIPLRPSRPVQSEPVNDKRLLDIFAKVKEDFALRRAKLEWGDYGTIPLIHSLFTPTVVLPRLAATWDDDNIELVFRHELAHTRQGHALSTLITWILVIGAYPIGVLFIWPLICSGGKMEDAVNDMVSRWFPGYRKKISEMVKECIAVSKHKDELDSFWGSLSGKFSLSAVSGEESNARLRSRKYPFRFQFRAVLAGLAVSVAAVFVPSLWYLSAPLSTVEHDTEIGRLIYTRGADRKYVYTGGVAVKEWGFIEDAPKGFAAPLKKLFMPEKYRISKVLENQTKRPEIKKMK